MLRSSVMGGPSVGRVTGAGTHRQDVQTVAPRRGEVAPPAGFEPATHGLEGREHWGSGVVTICADSHNNPTPAWVPVHLGRYTPTHPDVPRFNPTGGVLGGDGQRSQGCCGQHLRILLNVVTRWSSYVTDKFFAPELSKFTEAEIVDMSDADSQQEHWLSNFLLNSVLRAQVPTPQRQQFYNFLRHAHSAFSAYALARDTTLAYLEDRNHIRRYITAIGHWEDFLDHAWQALVFLDSGSRAWFEPGDGSELQRMHALHTRAKHAAAAIERGEFVGDSPLCVWLTNDGLKSTETALNFDEAAEVLRFLAGLADAVQDPLQTREKLARLDGE